MNEDAELSELLETAMMPAPAPRTVVVTKKNLVTKFLRDHEIEPGRAIGIEVCALYQLFLGWALKASGESTIVTPALFSRALKARGFAKRRIFRYRDRRVLCCSYNSAAFLRDWLKENPTTQTQRLLFCPAHRRRLSQ